MTPSPNFSIEINLPPGTQTAIDSIAKSLETIAQKIQTSNVDFKVAGLPQDEPAELSVRIPEDLIEKPAKRFTIVRTTVADGVIWNRITGHQRLMWREDGEWVCLLYNDSAVKTTWDEIKRLSRISKNRRRLEIQKMLSSRITDRITAVSVFVSSYLEGLVKAPEDPQEPVEDPDAVFRPIVTPYINTRPVEDCGSVESLQGAY